MHEQPTPDTRHAYRFAQCAAGYWHQGKLPNTQVDAVPGAPVHTQGQRLAHERSPSSVHAVTGKACAWSVASTLQPGDLPAHRRPMLGCPSSLARPLAHVGTLRRDARGRVAAHAAEGQNSAHRQTRARATDSEAWAKDAGAPKRPRSATSERGHPAMGRLQACYCSC